MATLKDAIMLAPALATMDLSANQWSAVGRLTEIQLELQAKVDKETFDLICEMQALSLDVLAEEYDRHYGASK